MTTLPYYSNELSRDAPELSGAAADQILNVLRSDQVTTQIEAGRLSLAMVRPNVGPEANTLGLDDLEAANEIESRIQGLGIAVKFSFYFDHDAVEEFYDGPAKTVSMMPDPPLKDNNFPNRWEEFKDLMVSGPTTALLVNGPEAINAWRSHLGHWDIVKNRDPGTIRGSVGVDNHNNLVHGSDSPQAVKRELDIISRSIQRQRNAEY